MATVSRRAKSVLALLAGALALAGCGASTRRVDRTRAEAQIRHLVARNHGKPLRSVWCPAGIAAKQGTRFQCRFVSASGSAGTITEHITSDTGSLTVGVDDVNVPAARLGLGLGTPVRFRNIPGLAPRAALVLVAGPPVDPGWAADGTSVLSLPTSLVWPSPGAGGRLTVRFVNVPVTVTNLGRAPLRVALTGAATDEQGRDTAEVNRDDSAWPGPHGRQPDWTSRRNPPIEPGTRATRYITFPIAQGSRMTVFSVWPMAVTSSGGTTEMSPESVSFLAQ